MNRKQRKARLKRFKLAKKMRRRQKALRLLRGLPPGMYHGTPHIHTEIGPRGRSFGLIVQTAQGPAYLPTLRLPVTGPT